MKSFRMSVYDRFLNVEKMVSKILDELEQPGAEANANNVYSVAKKLEYKLRDISDISLIELKGEKNDSQLDE